MDLGGQEGTRQVRFRVLGSVEAEVDGRWARPEQHKVRTLLAHLIVERDFPVSTEHLADDLWPDRARPDSARNLIHGYVRSLRRSLGVSDLMTVFPGYQLVTSADDVDVERFRTEVRAGERELAAGDPSAAMEHLRCGLALWRGPAFGDVARTPCLERAARVLEEERVSASSLVIRAQLATGHGEGTAAEIHTLLDAHPYNEGLWALLLRSLSCDGRTGEAIEAYHRAQRLLADQLGIEPGAELQDTYLRLIRGEESANGHAEVASPVHSTGHWQLPRQDSHFTGRERELTWLDRARAEGVPVVLVTGEAGVGKTALVTHWAWRVGVHFDGGVFFLDLALADGSGHGAVMSAVQGMVETLGEPAVPTPSNPFALLGRYRELTAREPILVVVDRGDGVSDLDRLSPAHPQGMVVVASRDVEVAADAVLVLEAPTA